MSCDIGKMMEGLEQSSFSNFSITSPTSQLILQPFCRFTYVTAHSPTLLLLHLHHSSYSNPSSASPTSQALHLIHMASRPCLIRWRWWTRQSSIEFVLFTIDPRYLNKFTCSIFSPLSNGCVKFDLLETLKYFVFCSLITSPNCAAYAYKGVL